MSDDQGVVAEDRRAMEGAREQRFNAELQKKSNRQDRDDQGVGSVSVSSKPSVVGKMRARVVQKAENNATKLGMRQADTYLLGFCTVSTLSFYGIILALVALIVLDIRWVVGKFSKRIPPMLLPHSIYLAVLNFTLAVIIFMISLVLLVSYCLSVASYSQLGKTAVTGNTDWINTCFE